MVHGQKQKPQGTPPKVRQLPWLALNEVTERQIKNILFFIQNLILTLTFSQVFIGESMSGRISALQFNDCTSDAFRSVKCSGICVTTGTGSTSWFRTIKSLTPQIVEEVLAKAYSEKKFTPKELEKICFDFNSSFLYAPGWHEFSIKLYLLFI